MITFRNNKINPEYLMINVKVDGSILITSEILPTFASNELQKMYFDLFEYEKEINTKIICKEYISEVAFPKSSLLGQWLLNNYDQKKLVYEDLFIYYEKVVNALNIAVYECSSMAERIIPLFRRQVSGAKEDLMKEYDEEVLDYILTHDDFYEWIEPEEKEPTEYFVFEDGEYSKKVLSTGKKVLEKSNQN